MIDIWESCFPYSKIRDEQRQAINFILNAFRSGKKYCVCELPTGTGKSAVGVTVARALQTDAYILTTQKVLQDQYTHDFGPRKLNLVQSIKSASNYDCCGFWGQSCGETRRVMSIMKRNRGGLPSTFNTCRQSCPYTETKTVFKNSPLGVTNFSYFLAETMYAHQLTPRGLLVLDEAHNVESSLSSFVEVVFSVKFAKSQLGCNGPRERTLEGVHKWIKNSYRKALNSKISTLEAEIETMQSAGKHEEDASTLAKRLELLDKHLCKVNRFLDDYDPKNWIMNAVAPELERKSADWKFEFKPIDVSPYAEDLLYRYGDKVLLMSATIIDHETFCSTIGIDVKKTAFLSLPSPFKAENRPVLFSPVGSMSRKNVDVTLPKMVETIKTLLEQHPDEKGIIHCIDSQTKVKMSNGSEIPISEILPGQVVCSWNEEKHLFENKTVYRVIDNGFRECIELVLENGKTLVCTPDHKILTKRGWIEASSLTEQDDIISIDDTYMNVGALTSKTSKNW